MTRRSWLLPVLSGLSRLAVRAFYRVEVAGEPVPATGPALLVANHPNSLVDPAAVSAAARRPVRFLAKAPLLTDPLVGWLVRAAGAVAVHRRQDGGAQDDANAEAFSAVQAALVAGDAVGIFPEGRSHDEPALSPLRTGAARMALAAARELGPLPLVPFGLTYARRERFRSAALVVVGPPVGWADLAPRGPTDAEAVRALTKRLDAALRRVTINLESSSDRLAVVTAEAVHAAERGPARGEADRIARLREASALLKELRREAPHRLARLFPALERFGRLLRALGLTAGDLDHLPTRRALARWIGTQLAVLLVGGPLLLLATLVFFVPHRVTAALAGRPALTLDTRATWKLLGGAAVFAAWIVALSVALAWALGAAGLVAGLLGLPALAVAGQVTVDRLGEAWTDARRFLTFRTRRHLRRRLLARRRELADAIDDVRRSVADDEPASR
jgi:1-acyl-sn-glycerol-3-phosphate acyltransferase